MMTSLAYFASMSCSLCEVIFGIRVGDEGLLQSLDPCQCAFVVSVRRSFRRTTVNV